MPIPLDIGDVVAGKYVVESTLGKGGMGVVLAARHVELDHRVAIKVLREGVLQSDEAHARFLQEARALASFQSDHLVRVFDVGRLESGTPYMVMEYLDGADLSTVLRNRGSLDVAESVAPGRSESRRRLRQRMSSDSESGTGSTAPAAAPAPEMERSIREAYDESLDTMGY